MERARLRKRLPRKPRFDEGLEQWAERYIKQQAWRCAPMFDEDDLLQEAWCLYKKLRVRYFWVEDAPHFMRLFQTSLRNLIHSLAAPRLKMTVVSAECDDGSSIFEDLEAKRDEYAVLEVLLSDAPDDLRRCIHEILGEREIVCRRVNGVRETRAERLQRLAGPDAAPDVLGRLTAFIRGVMPC